MNRLINKINFTLLIILSASLKAQVVDTSWTKTYGGDSHDYATSLLQADDGGYLLAGITYSYGAGDKDVYLVKTNPYGDTLWTKVYGDSLIDNVFAIKPTLDGGYVIGGWSSSYSGDNRDFDCYIVKIDYFGMLEWKSYCTDSSSGGAYDIVQTDDGGYLLAGGAKGAYPMINFDLFVVRADQFGDTVWTRRYIVPGRESWDGLAYSVTKTFDGNYVVAGEIFYQRENISDIYVLKINDNGDTLWTQIIDNQMREYAWDCTETPDNDIVLTGWTWAGFSDPTGDKVYLAKLTDGGEFLWQKIYAYPWPVSSYNDAWAAVVDPNDNGYLIVADTRQDMIDQRDIYVIKTDTEGDTLWTIKTGNNIDEAPSNIITTDDGGFAVCGMKYTLNSSGHLYEDFYLLKYESLTDIAPTDTYIPREIQLIQNYPNPFNGQTSIKYSLPVSAEVKLDILDILGRKIVSLINSRQPAGYHDIIWRGDDLPSGIYFFKLQAGDFVDTKKMVLLK
jgi:hypothetical protein